ncbi:MAG: tyrosine--tRNA ligase [Candidatus Micrarchaeota archaeon]|nr:tyrosine--tRNA ligase [Candidatus Micrarchaeota archaeon]MDE1859557.1 tyrosine--tRNA ligase [Candidatus Micrarchaeota archaeon]
MDIDARLDLIKSEPTEEIITEERMRNLLETKQHPVHYMGLEISGMPHIGHILVGGKKINDLDKAGVKTQVWLADWHTMANNKLGGDWDKIIKASKFYKELFNLFCPNTKVLLGSEVYHNNDDFWKLVMQMSRRTTLARATRTLVIMGRNEKETLHVSQYIYPIMQAADIDILGADIPHAGIDQRKVHVLALELFKDLKLRDIVPLHHHLIPSLAQPPKIQEGAEKEEVVAAMKMSKSKPGSAIPILADEAEIKSIMKTAWCPEGVAEGNPVLELCRYIIFPISSELKVERDRKFGGDVTYSSFKELHESFLDKKLHPMDLKNAVTSSLSKIMRPITTKFANQKEEIQNLFS